VPTVAAIEHYLRTGDHDPHFPEWTGDIIERERRAHDDLMRALIDEVSRRTAGRRPSAEMPAIDLTAFTRAKVEPMVRGLFPRAEQDVVLATLEKSVVYVTSETIEPLLTNHDYDSSAWDLANLIAVGTTLHLSARVAPRTDPDGRHYRIRFLSWMVA